MRLVFFTLAILISLVFLPAISADINNLCPFCYEEHNIQNIELDGAVIDEYRIPIDNLANIFAAYFPCLTQEIKTTLEQDFLPIPIKQERTVVAVKGRYILLSREQMFELLYISSVNSNNMKIPMSLADYHFFANIKIDKDKEKKYAWLMGSLFILFSAAGALANFSSFINIYETEGSVTNSTIVTTSTVNEIATLWVQNVVASLVTFWAALFSSMTNFSWAEFHLTITENFFRNFQSKLCELDNKFKDLSYALLELSFMKPIAAKMIANLIDENTLLQRLQISKYGNEVVKIKWLENFLSVVDCIKSDGKLWPKSLELQQFIRMH